MRVVPANRVISFPTYYFVIPRACRFTTLHRSSIRQSIYTLLAVFVQNRRKISTLQTVEILGSLIPVTFLGNGNHETFLLPNSDWSGAYTTIFVRTKLAWLTTVCIFSRQSNCSESKLGFDRTS